MSKVAVVYWSGSGNTEIMAEEICRCAKDNGADCELFFSDDFNKDMVNDYEKIAFGCPAMGNEELEESSFEPMFASLENNLTGKKIAIFGSYEWNDGQWMRDWEQRVIDDNAVLIYPPLAAYDKPDEDAIKKCQELGKALAE